MGIFYLKNILLFLILGTILETLVWLDEPRALFILTINTKLIIYPLAVFSRTHIDVSAVSPVRPHDRRHFSRLVSS